jgi:hypothetical protein
VPEDTLTGKTYLYVEKGIHIYIYKLPIAMWNATLFKNWKNK